MYDTRPPLPPFPAETAAQKARLAEAKKLLARAKEATDKDYSSRIAAEGLIDYGEGDPKKCFDYLDAPEALELLSKAADPDQAARLWRSQIAAALTRARRHRVQERAAAMQQALRAPALRQPAPVQAAYAAVVQAQVRILAELSGQVDALGEVVAEHCGRHPDAEVIASLPGLGPILGARVLGEFGDAPGRYVDAKARKNYAGTSPITRASGRRKVVMARYARNTHLADAIHMAADNMPAQAAGRRQGFFQVDPRARLQVAQGGEIQALYRHVGPVAVARQFHHRQAAAVGADAVAQLNVGQVQLAGIDAQPQVAPGRLRGSDFAHCLDDACEHGSSLNRGRR